MTQQAQKIHSLSNELVEAKTTIRMLNKRNESDIVSSCSLVTEEKWGLDEEHFSWLRREISMYWFKFIDRCYVNSLFGYVFRWFCGDYYPANRVFFKCSKESLLVGQESIGLRCPKLVWPVAVEDSLFLLLACEQAALGCSGARDGGPTTPLSWLRSILGPFFWLGIYLSYGRHHEISSVYMQR